MSAAQFFCPVTCECAPPAAINYAAPVVAHGLGVGIGGGRTCSRLYLDPGYGFVASFFSSTCAFFRWDACNFFLELVKGSLAASVDRFIAHALFATQAVGAFCREHVHNCCSFAGFVAIRVSTFVDGFGVAGRAGAYECGQCNSLRHFVAPSSIYGVLHVPGQALSGSSGLAVPAQSVGHAS